MYECVKHNVDFLLAGSIRDDGPLPDVITDVLEAQRQMREQIRDVTFCLMIATTLHSIAVGNLLPAWVKVVCVDINPSTVIKLSDRGSFQTVGLVTDVEPFLRALVQEITALEESVVVDVSASGTFICPQECQHQQHAKLQASDGCQLRRKSHQARRETAPARSDGRAFEARTATIPAAAAIPSDRRIAGAD